MRVESETVTDYDSDEEEEEEAETDEAEREERQMGILASILNQLICVFSFLFISLPLGNAWNCA